MSVSGMVVTYGGYTFYFLGSKGLPKCLKHILLSISVYKVEGVPYIHH
jgi:hypothetical protein